MDYPQIPGKHFLKSNNSYSFVGAKQPRANPKAVTIKTATHVLQTGVHFTFFSFLQDYLPVFFLTFINPWR